MGAPAVSSYDQPCPAARSLAEVFAERNKVFAERKSALELYRNVVDTCPLPTFLADDQGQLVYANCAYCRLVGAENLEEVLGNGWKNFLAPGCRERIYAEWRRMIARRVQKFERVEPNLQSHQSGAVVSAIRVMRLECGHYVGFIVPEKFRELLTADWTSL
jgi:PAS domain S-box-containing protein